MRSIILVLLLVAYSFSGEINQKDSFDEFDNEFKERSVEIFDPLSGYNRVMTTFNDYFLRDVFIPLSRGYAYVVPEIARDGVDNFFRNLFFPVRFVNNILQLKFAGATIELGRFFINTTWGVLGFMDMATTKMHLKPYKEDFGQTLGFYGIGNDVHIVLPFAGPSNLRDVIGLGVDFIISPTSQLGNNALEYKLPQNTLQESSIDMLFKVNENSYSPDRYEVLTKDAIDLYIYLRDTYNQRRNKEISE